MPIIGTAGHVDHGKSTLVQALTGRDPDRWVEEKARGLTIDLGFAWTDLGDGSPVGFVDVPGHERFIKNMLAGVGALDVAMLVVAADEGWMPQTEEHFSVLELLDLAHGVIALTRTDLVDEDTAELAALEIAEEVAGSRLEQWPVVAVAAPAGTGIEQLRSALLAQVQLAGPARDRGRPRLWIDRAFTIAGAGTVVTGTLTDGSLAAGDELAMWPGPHRVRVRTIQSHERQLDVVGPGNRTALNLAGVDHTDIQRGALLAAPRTLLPTHQALTSLLPVRGLDDELTERGAYHAHIGSGTWPARLRLVDEDAALLSFSSQIALQVGDRYILREVGRRAVVGGGRVLDPHPSPRLATTAASLPSLRSVADAPPDEIAQVLLDVRGASTLDELAADSGGGVPRSGTIGDGEALSTAEAERAADLLRTHVTRFQEANPLREGAPRGELVSISGLSPGLVTALVGQMDELVDHGATVSTRGFAGGWGPDQQQAFESTEQRLLEAGLAVPRASQLGLDPELLHACIRAGRLVRVGDDLVYLPEQVDRIVAGLGELPDEFTVAQFRDAFGLSRRQAVPLLEWLDGQGRTSRRGDVRTVRQPHG